MFLEPGQAGLVADDHQDVMGVQAQFLFGIEVEFL